jgi:hypothetical protein
MNANNTSSSQPYSLEVTLFNNKYLAFDVFDTKIVNFIDLFVILIFHYLC